MSRITTPRPGTVLLAVTVWLASIATTTRTRLTVALDGQPRDRGAITLEQAILTAVISAAAIALGVVIVNAITSHSANIK